MKPTDPQIKEITKAVNSLANQNLTEGWYKYVGSSEETDAQVAEGDHYKRFHIPETWVGQPLDPALIQVAYPDLSAMQVSIIKKALRLGDGDKSRKQDLLDIIGAARRQLEIDELRLPR